MAQNYEVRYTLIFEGGGKSTQATTIQGNNLTPSEAEYKIRSTNNINSNVREIIITEIIPR